MTYTQEVDYLVGRIWELLMDGDGTCHDQRCKVLEALRHKNQEEWVEQEKEMEEKVSLRIVKDDFYRVYDELAKKGKTDGAGGMEYRRVRLAWEKSDKSSPMKKFILDNV